MTIAVVSWAEMAEHFLFSPLETRIDRCFDLFIRLVIAGICASKH